MLKKDCKNHRAGGLEHRFYGGVGTISVHTVGISVFGDILWLSLGLRLSLIFPYFQDSAPPGGMNCGFSSMLLASQNRCI